MKFFIFILKISFLISTIFITVNILHNGKNIQKIKVVNSHIDDVSKTIFNPNEWRCRIAKIVYKKIETIDLTEITNIIASLGEQYYIKSTKKIREADIFTFGDGILDTFLKFGKTVKNKVKIQVTDFLLPKFKSYLLHEIKKNRKELKKILKKSFKNGVDKVIKSDKDSKNYTKSCQKKEIPVLLSTTDIENKNLKLTAILFSIFIFYNFLIIVLKKFKVKINFKLFYIDLIIFLTLSLIIGLNLPMIEVNATLKELNFKLFDSSVEFINPTLYYRSKSIVDIVSDLFKGNPFVAIMILLFSIVFPSIKILLSLLSTLFQKIRDNKVVTFILVNIGKWSMADVFVVSIFLSTLSFRSILDDQVSKLYNVKNIEVAINTETSKLEIGFYYFLFYTIFSIFLSHFILKELKVDKNKYD